MNEHQGSTRAHHQNTPLPREHAALARVPGLRDEARAGFQPPPVPQLGTPIEQTSVQTTSVRTTADKITPELGYFYFNF